MLIVGLYFPLCYPGSGVSFPEKRRLSYLYKGNRGVFSPCTIFAEFCKFVIVYSLYVLLEYTCFYVSDFTNSNKMLTAKTIDPSELIAQYNFGYKSKIIVRKAFFDK